VLAAVPLLRPALLGFVILTGNAAEGAAAPSYAQDIQPLFAERCDSCHGATKQKAALRLDSLAAVLKGGEYGPVLTPGRPEASTLLKLIRLPKDDGDRMPPKGEPLTPAQALVVERWIAAGAPE
jgi:mono/diheme cytochrome c family protein